MELRRKFRHRGMGNKHFFLHPKPFKGELLSSWLVRIALMHRISPVTFMNIHFPELKPDIWSRDIDLYWGTRPNLIEKLSYKSRIPIKKLMNCTLNSYEGYLDEKIHSNTRNKLITSVVNRGRESQGKGLRFCPICLKNDMIPFFRKEWRLSFVTVCLKHKCFLSDCCPNCKSPVNIYKLIKNDNLSRCYRCDSSYLDAQIEKIPSNSYGMQAQKNLLHVLHSGIFDFERGNYLSLAFFPVLKQITKLIYNFNLRAMALDHESLTSTITLPNFKINPSLYVEDIPIHEQYIIYSASEYLLRNLNSVHLFCKANKIEKGILTHSMEYIPFWFSIIVWENDLSLYSISIREAESAIHYLKKNKIPLSFSSLSKLVGSKIEARRREDIYKVMHKYLEG